MKLFKKLQAKYTQKEKEQNIISRREGTMYNLLVGMTTDESIEMYNQISVLFVSAAEKRLKEVSEEKSNLEKFLTIKAKHNEKV